MPLPIVWPAKVLEVPISRRVEKVAEMCLDASWLQETKHDGYRCLIRFERNLLQLITKDRKLHSVLNKFSEELRVFFTKFTIHSLILDCELMGFNELGGEDFFSIVKSAGVRKLFTFDLLYLNGEDYRAEPLNKRKERLQAFVDILWLSQNDLVHYVPHTNLSSEKEAGAFRDDVNWEGVVFKYAYSVYNDPTYPWYKFKNPNYNKYPDRANRFRAARRKRS